MGNAVRQSMAAQVVNPEPDYQGQPQTTAATQAAGAVERYRNGTVKKPDTIRTTQGSSGGPQ
jgi:type IV pilus biogenesis protein CpaD/CtpE